MSTITYDFRKVLDAQPLQRTCVGTTKMGRDGPKRCSNPLTVTNCAQAEGILDEMNKSRAASLQNIEDLALAMLCKEHNNEKTRPDLCQVDELCVKWEARIEEYERSLKLQVARKAVMNSMKELNSMQKTVENITGKKAHKRKSSMTTRSILKSPEKQVVVEALPGTTISTKLDVPLKTESKVEDCLPTSRSSHRNSITAKGNYSIFPSTYTKETPVRESLVKPSPDTTRRPPLTKIDTSTADQRETWCLPIQHPGPLPPSKNSPRSGRSRAATTPSTRSPKRATALRPAAPKESPEIKPRIPSQTFNFQLPLTKVEKEIKPDASNCHASLQGPLPTFDYSLISQLPGPRHSVVEDSPTLARTAPSLEFATSAYRIPPKIFQFEKKSEPVFAMNLPEILAELAAPPVKQPFSISTKKELPNKPDSAYLHITTPPQTPPRDMSPRPSKSSLTAPNYHNLPSTPDSIPSATFPRTSSPYLRTHTPPTITRVPSKNRLSTLLNTLPPLPTRTPYNDDFGYATVTPTAMRYKTFKLPKRSGLATPPETPDPLPRLGLYTGPFQPTKFPAFNVGGELEKRSAERKSPERRSIQRKPVPLRRSVDEECTHIWAMKPTGPSPIAARTLLGSPVMRRPAAENSNWPIRLEGASLAPRRVTGMSMSEEERMELNCVRGIGLPRLRKRMLRHMIGMKSKVDGQPKHGFPSFI